MTKIKSLPSKLQSLNHKPKIDSVLGLLTVHIQANLILIHPLSRYIHKISGTRLIKSKFFQLTILS